MNYKVLFIVLNIYAIFTLLTFHGKIVRKYIKIYDGGCYNKYYYTVKKWNGFGDYQMAIDKLSPTICQLIDYDSMLFVGTKVPVYQKENSNNCTMTPPDNSEKCENKSSDIIHIYTLLICMIVVTVFTCYISIDYYKKL